ncbi:MAG: hypothetical protein EXR62_08760 [Chloroflexi bacterium]|nr:hypothetical protein [Chloroflexota bacterium]
MPTLHIQLLGKFHLHYGEAGVPGFTHARLQSLLAYLLLHRDASQSRRQVAFLFWPDSTEAQAHNSLRQLLFLLRKALPEAERFLAIDPETVQWRPDGPFILDLAEFERAADQAQRAGAGDAPTGLREALERAVDLYDGAGGPPLSGLLPDCYDDWILPERERYQRAFVQVVARLADLLESQQEYRTAISYTQRLLRHDPLDEATYRRLLRLYSLSGDRAGARRLYHTCVETLQRELDADPEPETQAAYETWVVAKEPLAPAGPVPGATLQRPRHNLPAQLTSFIGREKEIAAVKGLLARARLVTLTGVGGTGKTRLGLQVAGTLLDSFPQGVWLVELAPLSDPALLPHTVATALGLRLEPGQPLVKALTDYLQVKHLLLMLDNCEHLVEASARLVEALLRACSQVTILASSREALGIAGEVPFPVPSLALPDTRHLPPVASLADYEAIRLFIDRATAALPGFTFTGQNAPAVAQVCYRLDGIPLAIELAAARVKMLQVEQIEARLDDRFRLLTGGSRTALPRQQTLQSAIDWSYNLLSLPEHALLRRLSVFAGGWMLAAETVCADVGAGGDSIRDYEILDLLASLVSKSLVLVEHGPEGQARYRLLETIRQYARDKLLEAGEGEAVRQRHLAYYLQLGEEGGQKLRGSEQLAWFKRLGEELENFRAAIQWSLGAAPGSVIPELGVQLTWALFSYWLHTGSQLEGGGYCESFLGLPTGQEQTAARALALLGAQWFGLRGSDTTYIDESIALFRQVGDKRGLAWALVNLGSIEGFTRLNFPRAETLLAESDGLFQELGIAGVWPGCASSRRSRL